jgi:hypothetical protein
MPIYFNHIFFAKKIISIETDSIETPVIARKRKRDYFPDEEIPGIGISDMDERAFSLYCFEDLSPLPPLDRVQRYPESFLPFSLMGASDEAFSSQEFDFLPPFPPVGHVQSDIDRPLPSCLMGVQERDCREFPDVGTYLTQPTDFLSQHETIPLQLESIPWQPESIPFQTESSETIVAEITDPSMYAISPLSESITGAYDHDQFMDVEEPSMLTSGLLPVAERDYPLSQFMVASVQQDLMEQETDHIVVEPQPATLVQPISIVAQPVFDNETVEVPVLTRTEFAVRMDKFRHDRQVRSFDVCFQELLGDCAVFRKTGGEVDYYQLWIEDPEKKHPVTNESLYYGLKIRQAPFKGETFISTNGVRDASLDVDGMHWYLEIYESLEDVDVDKKGGGKEKLLSVSRLSQNGTSMELSWITKGIRVSGKQVKDGIWKPLTRMIGNEKILIHDDSKLNNCKTGKFIVALRTFLGIASRKTWYEDDGFSIVPCYKWEDSKHKQVTQIPHLCYAAREAAGKIEITILDEYIRTYHQKSESSWRRIKSKYLGSMTSTSNLRDLLQNMYSVSHKFRVNGLSEKVKVDGTDLCLNYSEFANDLKYVSNTLLTSYKLSGVVRADFKRYMLLLDIIKMHYIFEAAGDSLVFPGDPKPPIHEAISFDDMIGKYLKGSSELSFPQGWDELIEILENKGVFSENRAYFGC